ncbi:hypothetical protein ASPZODRAFT_105222 [Penicilliopsis zonata CBS 506.65]|uniref:FAD/NAD(P)-binding domain-containing protein n=1 Tax=Penicilliopsis zonata CBS 506.65 TaxID=1073090 RepID=A0A1L9S5Q8_9EURO|nr:hypothetical protein ASPZODRAFT_105222 [Penicilliopsis zonata CBS 506.65]OJJ42492.1 hypothetical protein ASPZODRAFT_105222 [Penicilliopsis zonata CBS 506.65]
MSYDAIIIGSGQSGAPLAVAFAKAGHRTALVEREHIGGCCINEGCTPTKTMIASGRVAYLTRRAGDYGVLTSSEVMVDMAKVRQRKRDIVASFRAGSEHRIQAAGVELITGNARFIDRNTLKVTDGHGGEQMVQGDKIFVNVGERPAPPSVEGLEAVDPGRVLDSTSIQELDAVPKHLVVVGGGYVGVEFAQLFRRLGAEVTIVQRGKQLMPREDADIAQRLLEIFQQDGLTVHTESRPLRIVSAGDKGFILTIHRRAGDRDIPGTHILFAAGRIPNTETLNLAAAGIQTDRKGYIETNASLETSTPGIYAMGDVKGPPAFTHVSYDDFRILRENLIDQSSALTRSTADRIVPYVVFTDPQLAHVGLHEHEAREQFPARQIQTATMPMSYVARALETDEPRGTMKAVVDAPSGQILGFTCLGVDGGEVMSVVQTAMVGGTPYRKLQDAVFAHPVLAESLNNLWSFLQSDTRPQVD